MHGMRKTAGQAYVTFDASGAVTGCVIAKSSWAHIVVRRWLEGQTAGRIERVSVEEALALSSPHARISTTDSMDAARQASRDLHRSAA